MVTATRPPAEATTMRTTRVFEDILEAYRAGMRRILLQGGTSSSKTWSVLQALILIAKYSAAPLLISVVSESMPHLRKGAIRDFFKILNETEDNNPNWSKTTFTYTMGLSLIEFFGADDPSKVRGPRRDILFINEGNNIPWETARGLDIRTSKFTIVDWNPVGQFWAHEFWMNSPENAYSRSTYLDARDVLAPEVVANIESNKDKDPNWWTIYGLGEMGKVTDLVYPNFEQVDVLPAGAVFYGLDFGFMVDPTALVANVLIGDKLYSQELIYSLGMDNQQIARQMDLLKVPHNSQGWADPDEEKSIVEIQRAGYTGMQPGVKGKGSVEYAQQKVNQLYQFWTKDSLNAIKEQRNFRYIRRRDSTGHEYLSDDTTHQWSHCMRARGYAVVGHGMAGSGIVKPPVNHYGVRRMVPSGRY